MENLMENISNVHTYLFEDLASPVTKGWFLTGSPYKLLFVITVYLYFVKILGPRYMQNRKPYNLNSVLKYYNLAQVIISLYLFNEGINYLFSREFNILCQNTEDPRTPRAYRVANMAWTYLIVKVVDLLDTVFFVLRKSDRQITSLHVHHHTMMPAASWLAATYFPGGQTVVLGCLNSFVHAVMYGYYFVAGLGDNYKQYLWWKRHVTELQLVQFLIVGLHASISMFFECGFPMFLKLFTLSYAVIFTYMFGTFYYNNYIIKKKETAINGKDKLVKANLRNGKDVADNGHKNDEENKCIQYIDKYF